MLRHITFHSRGELTSMNRSDDIAVISINDPGRDAPNLIGFHSWFVTAFDDISPDDDLKTREEFYQNSFLLFDTFLAEGILGYARDLHELKRHIDLCIHCQYGESRSPAVAFAIAELIGGTMTRDLEQRQPNCLVLDVFGVALPK